MAGFIFMLVMVGLILWSWIASAKRDRRRLASNHQKHAGLVVHTQPGPRRRHRVPFLQALPILLAQTAASAVLTVQAMRDAFVQRLDRKPLKGEWRSPPIEETKPVVDMSSNPFAFPSLPTESTKITLRTAVPEPEPSAQNQEPAAEPSYKLKLSRVQAIAHLLNNGVTPEQFIQAQDGDRIAIRDALLCNIKAGILATAMGGARATRLAEIKAAAYEDDKDGSL